LFQKSEFAGQLGEAFVVDAKLATNTLIFCRVSRRSIRKKWSLTPIIQVALPLNSQKAR